MHTSQQRLGLTFAALCALNGALVPGVAKLLTARIDPFLLATLTTVCGAICAIVLLAVRGELGLLVRRDLALRLAALGALGTTAAYLFFFFGAQRASAIETVLVLQIEPAYALLFSWGVLGHRPTPRRVAAILVTLVGILFAVGWEAGAWSDLSGPALLLLPPLCWQLSHLITLRGLVGVSPLVLTGARYIYGAVFLVAAWATMHGGTPLPLAAILEAMPLLIFQGAVLYYLGTLLWYHAVLRLDLTRATAIVVPSIPILSFAASFVLLG
jgi:drug/metabolite transporter (DMT)-like permease